MEDDVYKRCLQGDGDLQPMKEDVYKMFTIWQPMEKDVYKMFTI